jgi:hypothetical protein
VGSQSNKIAVILTNWILKFIYVGFTIYIKSSCYCMSKLLSSVEQTFILFKYAINSWSIFFCNSSLFDLKSYLVFLKILSKFSE